MGDADAVWERLLALGARVGGPLLGLDTSTAAASICLVVPASGRVDERIVAGDRPMAEEAVRVLSELAELHGLRWQSLRGLVVGLGPGSFTGLRVGLALAKGLAMGGDVPLYGVSSLLAACGGAPIGRCLAAVDARRDEWFLAGYARDSRGATTTLIDDCVVGQTEALRLATVAAPQHLVGDRADALGVQLAVQAWQAEVVRASVRIGVAMVAAEDRIVRGDADPTKDLVPRYLRLSEPERKLLG